MIDSLVSCRLWTSSVSLCVACNRHVLLPLCVCSTQLTDEVASEILLHHAASLTAGVAVTAPSGTVRSAIMAF